MSVEFDAWHGMACLCFMLARVSLFIASLVLFVVTHINDLCNGGHYIALFSLPTLCKSQELCLPHLLFLCLPSSPVDMLFSHDGGCNSYG